MYSENTPLQRVSCLKFSSGVPLGAATSLGVGLCWGCRGPAPSSGDSRDLARGGLLSGRGSVTSGHRELRVGPFSLSIDSCFEKTEHCMPALAEDEVFLRSTGSLHAFRPHLSQHHERQGRALPHGFSPGSRRYLVPADRTCNRSRKPDESGGQSRMTTIAHTSLTVP